MTTVVIEAVIMMAVVVSTVVVKSPVCTGTVSIILPDVLEINARAAVVTDVLACIMFVVGDDIVDGV